MTQPDPGAASENRAPARGGWRDGAQPPWWPAGEPWPPRRRSTAARVARGIGCLFGVLALLALVGGFISAVMFHDGSWGGPPPDGRGYDGSPFFGVFVVGLFVLFFVGAGVLAFGSRRIARPLGDLVEASRRINANDYGARVPEQARGPRELRELVRTFNSMAAHLETNETQRRTLLADIGHEMRTPLAVLQGEIEAMLDGVYPADEAHLSTALDESRVLARLVDDLRTLTLAEAGTLALHIEPVDVGVLATEVADAFRQTAEAGGQRVTVALDEELPLIEVDPVRIREVLSNLVSNALRYAPPGSAVEIEASSDEQRVVLTVMDSGPGIPPDVLPHVFERFAKSEDSRGSGLGLAIARGLVEAHGGTISVESGSTGTTMRVELPLERVG
jgi:two-component system sensor histidine kinase BaeS